MTLELFNTNLVYGEWKFLIFNSYRPEIFNRPKIHSEKQGLYRKEKHCFLAFNVVVIIIESTELIFKTNLNSLTAAELVMMATD